MRRTPPYGRKWRGNKESLMKVKEDSEKVGLKLNIQKTKTMASGPITSWQIDGETEEIMTNFILGGSRITADGNCSHEIKRRLWHPTPVLLPGKSYGWRSLVGCSPWGRKESDTTERLHFHFSLSCIGGGNGNPLQCSCLENPRDREPGGLPSMRSHRVEHDWSDLVVVLHGRKVMTNLDSILKSRDIVNKGLSSQGYGFSSSHVWMWELNYKESWAPKNWCYWTEVLEKTLESPLDCKEIQPVYPKGDQSWVFIGRTVEAETPIFWPPDAKNWLIGKDSDAGKDWRQEEKGTTEDEMVGWHHWVNEHEFE